MNIKLVCKIMGRVITVEALMLLLPMLISALYREAAWHAFLLPSLIAAAAGLLMVYFARGAKKGLHMREGFIIVGGTWLIMSLIGALPFLFSGVVSSFTDALFESVSGFTTTGATILRDVEAIPRGLLFWRSLTQWIGGMGVLIMFLALLPSMGERSIQLLRAEAPGHSPGKLVPKIGETAKILYIIYIALTVLEAIILFVAGMPLFDSVNHALTTAGTGGFSVKNSSIGYYNSSVINIIVSIFMIIFGLNFALFYSVFRKRWKEALKNSELRLFGIIIAAAAVMITADLMLVKGYSFGDALNHGFFQVTSIATTTAFATTDYGIWPMYSHVVFIFLMFIGACSGSTGGGLKVSRFFILLKSGFRDIKKVLHPRAVSTVRMSGKPIEEEVIRGVSVYFFLYLIVIAVSSLVISLDRFDLTTSMTTALASVSNIGPGLGAAGPVNNYADFNSLSKLTMGLSMLMGRLELYPVLVLFLPAAWKKQ